MTYVSTRPQDSSTQMQRRHLKLNAVKTNSWCPLVPPQTVPPTSLTQTSQKPSSHPCLPLSHLTPKIESIISLISSACRAHAIYSSLFTPLRRPSSKPLWPPDNYNCLLTGSPASILPSPLPTAQPQCSNQREPSKHRPRTSLVAQWLRICLPAQGTWVRALVREDPTYCRATKPVRHKYRACALEPASHNYWAHTPQLLKPTRLQPVLRSRRSHRNETPAHRNEDPTQPKINKYV